MKSFLSYWKPSTADYNVGRERPLSHIASNQYHRLAPDDEVFIVTARTGVLLLVSKVVVGRIVDQQAAEAHQGHKLWKSSYHVLSKLGTELPLKEINISHLVDNLRFESERDRLSVDGGLVKAAQLQTMRELTRQSAAHLDAAVRRAN